LQQKKIRIQARAKNGLSFPNCRIVILRLTMWQGGTCQALVFDIGQVTPHELPGMIVA